MTASTSTLYHLLPTPTTTPPWTPILNTSLTMMSSHNISDNSTAGDGEDRPGPLISLAVPLLMFSTGVLGNVLALILLWRSRKENARSVFFRLVAGLAVTDLFGLIALSPVTILIYSNDLQWVGGQPLCNYHAFMMIFAGLATVLIVLFMALERYLAVLHPYLYERRVAPEKVKAAIGVIWLVAALISCLPLVSVGRNVRHFPGTWCFFDFLSSRPADKVFSIFYASIGLLVIAATAVCNVAVMVVLLRMRRVSQNIGKSSEGRTMNMTSEMQMIFFLAGIILVFATCYAPLMVRVIINVSETLPVNGQADLMAIRLASLNQILDPWVYLLFRRRLAALLYSTCKAVSPLHNLSSVKALRSEFQNSPRNSPALRQASHFRYPAVSRVEEEEEEKAGSRTSLSLQKDSSDVVCSSSRHSDSRPSSLIVKSDCNGHCSLEVVQAGEASIDAPLLNASSVDVQVFPETSGDENSKQCLADSFTPGQPECRHGLSPTEGEGSRERLPEAMSSDRQDDLQKLTDSETSAEQCKTSPEHERETTGQDPADPQHARSKQSLTANSVSSDVTPPADHAVTVTSSTEHGSPGVNRELTSSLTWPVVCRHGNQSVVRMDSCNGEASHNVPLLGRERHSLAETSCSQCKRTSQDLSYV